MIQKILVAYDGSPQSREALKWAMYLSRRTKAAVSAIKVFEPYLRESVVKEVGVLPEGMIERYATAQIKDLALMEEVKALGQGQGLEITTAVLQGHVAQTILEYAKTNGVSIIIAGTRGRGALKQLLLGSVTHGLVGLAEIPVLVVKTGPVAQAVSDSVIMPALCRILAAYDGSPHSKAALSWAAGIAKQVGAQVTAVKVNEPFQTGNMLEIGSYISTVDMIKELEVANVKLLDEARELGRQQGVDIVAEILDGNALEGLLEYADNQAVDMIAVGAQGHWIPNKLPLGSVPHGLISLSSVPVLVVKI
jgi:nucleotide-binding universal stress UspA family protein